MSVESLRAVLADRAADLATANPGRVREVRLLIRRRQRRRAAVGGGALGAVAVAAAALALTVGGAERADGPVVDPTPPPVDRSDVDQGSGRRTPLTPRETVTREDAVLLGAATSLGDPDVRVSRWHTVCGDCRKVGRSRPSFYALAVTDDGYRTTTYVRDPAQGEAYVVESPTDDVFLLNDPGNGVEWLVGTDGSVRSVQRVDTPIRPRDPRRWFLCTEPGSGPRSWCALDPATATAYQWPPGSDRGGWTESHPDDAGAAWGLDFDQDTGPAAWWQPPGGTRQTRPLEAGQFGTVHHAQQGPTFWEWSSGADTMDLLVVSDPEGVGRVVTRPAPDVPESDRGGYLDLGQTPGGALLAWSDWPDLRIWRADTLDGADFELVVDREGVPGGMPLTVAGGRLHLHSLVSDDDGRTWSGPERWR